MKWVYVEVSKTILILCDTGSYLDERFADETFLWLFCFVLRFVGRRRAAKANLLPALARIKIHNHQHNQRLSL